MGCFGNSVPRFLSSTRQVIGVSVNNEPEGVSDRGGDWLELPGDWALES